MEKLKTSPISLKSENHQEPNIELALQMKTLNSVLKDSKTNFLPGIQYVGCGYNILAGYANAKYVKSSLFDLSVTKFKEYDFDKNTYSIFDFLEIVKSPESRYEQLTAVSSEIYQNKISESVEIGGAFKGFSASLSTGFEKSVTESSTNSFTSIENYAHYYHTILDLIRFKASLKEEVKTLINSGNTTVLFEKYGTHFLAGIIYGAKASISLSFDKYDNNITSSTSVDAKAGFLKLVSGGTSIKTNTGTEISLSTGQIKVMTFGGDINIASTNLLTPEGYDEWVRSITLENSSMVDFSPNGSALVGVWELADSEDRKEFVKAAANKFIDDHQNDIEIRGKVNYMISVKTGNKDYAGTGEFVSIEIFGSRGQSQRIKLYDQGHFEKNTVKDFFVNIDDLGDLSKIIIYNENYSHNITYPGWFLEKVNVVAGATKATKNNPHHYNSKFFFNNWLQNDKGYKTYAEIPVSLTTAKVLAL